MVGATGIEWVEARGVLNTPQRKDGLHTQKGPAPRVSTAQLRKLSPEALAINVSLSYLLKKKISSEFVTILLLLFKFWFLVPRHMGS